MNVAAGPKLAAAVTNAGGLGVIGGLAYSPDMLREQIDELKSYLHDKNAPFGIDLLLPQVGGSARKTKYVIHPLSGIHLCYAISMRNTSRSSYRVESNTYPTYYSYDYTKGKLGELIDVIIESGAKLFVSAVGVPPKAVVEKLHKHGVVYMNMVGHPKHVQKCIDIGCDIICAQGGEGGGHTGDVPTTVLIPACVQICKGKKSPLTGKQIPVIAAGGIHNGQMLAAALMMGADAVWVGTRFILVDEAGAPKEHKESVKTAGFDDTIRTLIFTGRPLRVRKNPYIENWENERQAEIKELTAKGILPYEADLEKASKEGPSSDSGDGNASEEDIEDIMDQYRPILMGKCAALVNEQKSAKEVVDEFVNDATEALQKGSKMTSKL